MFCGYISNLHPVHTTVALISMDALLECKVHNTLRLQGICPPAPAFPANFSLEQALHGIVSYRTNVCLKFTNWVELCTAIPSAREKLTQG